MKLSDNTMTVLKNFSSINPSLFVRTGNVLRTISPQKTIMAKAELEDNFDKDLGIHDLGRFIGVLSMFDDHDIDWRDKYAILKDKSSNDFSINYTYCDPSTFATPPTKDVVLPIPDVNFHLKTENLNRVMKSANFLQLPEIAVVGDGTNLMLKAYNSKNPTADSSTKVIGATDKNFTAIYKIENLNIIPGDYDVSISSKGISTFTSSKLTYWIAIEATSNFS
jgi:gp45 sliding clamp, C terminal